MSDVPLLKEFAAAAILAALAGFLVYAAWQIWAAATGRRTGDDEDEYEQEPCPECGYDVRASRGKCPECGADIASRHRYFRALSEDWPETNLDPRVPAPGEELVMLHSTPVAFEADLLRDQLLARGIRSEAGVWQETGVARAAGRAPPFHRVLVYSGDAEAAKAYLERLRRAASELPQPARTPQPRGDAGDAVEEQ
jgi:hypothetical protein